MELDAKFIAFLTYLKLGCRKYIFLFESSYKSYHKFETVHLISLWQKQALYCRMPGTLYFSPLFI